MLTLGARLKQARKDAQLSQAYVATVLNHKYGMNVPRESISRWENDIRYPRQDIISKLAEIYNVPIETLIGTPIIIAKDTSFPARNQEKSFLLPIIGNVSAGSGAYADNSIEGYEYVPESWIHDGTEVLLKVKGDSMYPKFEENDLILVHPQENLENGEYGVVLIDDDNGVVKRVMYTDDSIELVSANPLYSPRVFAHEEMSRLRIFGKVKRLIRNC